MLKLNLVLVVLLASRCSTENVSWRSYLYYGNQKTISSIVKIRNNNQARVIDENFLSLTIDTDLVKWKFRGFQFGSPKLQNMARALSPCMLRLGGTNADFLIFDPHDNGSDSFQEKLGQDDFLLDSDFWPGIYRKNLTNFTMTGKEWKEFTSFASKVGWDIMFDFNLFRWTKNSLWDPSNAKQLLNYSANHGIKIKAFQLGNEPNAFKHNFNFSIGPDVLVKDFKILRQLIDKYPLYRGSPLFGPDVTRINVHVSSRKYLEGFLDAKGYEVVKEISLHHYYADGRTATTDTFMDHSLMDTLIEEITLAQNASRRHPGQLPVCFTETSSCYGGGAPGLSNGFVAGFLWLDKLGLSAKLGVTKVYRQTFFGGSYSLITNNLEPNPDFFLSVLFKRLVGGPVLDIDAEPKTEKLRVYANCALNHSYPAGSVVVYYLNLGKSDVNISIKNFTGALDLYLLTPGDSAGLKSRYVKLNGNVLKMNGSKLPKLNPRSHKGPVHIEGETFGFIVAPGLRNPVCQNYFAVGHSVLPLKKIN